MPSYAFFHKQFVPLPEAKIGVMTHCLHYGTAIFEGIRGNWNSEQQQLYLFRLKQGVITTCQFCLFMSFFGCASIGRHSSFGLHHRSRYYSISITLQIWSKPSLVTVIKSSRVRQEPCHVTVEK